MWPGRACIIGGAPSSSSDNYGGASQPGSVPTNTKANGIWAPSQAAFYLNNLFFGLEWPQIPDPSFSSVKVNWHGNWKGAVEGGTGTGNIRMLPPSRAPAADDGYEIVAATTGGLGQYHRKSGLYSLFGVNGRIIHNTSSSITLGSGDLTLEGWLYCTDNTVGSIMWDCRGSSTANVQPLIYLNGTVPNVGKLTYNRGGTGDIVIDAAVMGTNAWHHFALCRSSGTMYLYKDGVSVGSTADATNFGSSNTWRIGRNVPATLDFKGYLSEFRCTVGVARYPGGTTFTVPSSPFPDY